jgi:hypothetical protein
LFINSTEKLVAATFPAGRVYVIAEDFFCTFRPCTSSTAEEDARFTLSISDPLAGRERVRSNQKTLPDIGTTSHSSSSARPPAKDTVRSEEVRFPPPVLEIGAENETARCGEDTISKVTAGGAEGDLLLDAVEDGVLDGVGVVEDVAVLDEVGVLVDVGVPVAVVDAVLDAVGELVRVAVGVGKSLPEGAILDDAVGVAVFEGV